MKSIHFKPQTLSHLELGIAEGISEELCIRKCHFYTSLAGETLG